MRGRMVRNVRLDRNEQWFARKTEKMGKSLPQGAFSVAALLVTHTSSAGGELREGFGDLHSSVTVDSEAACVCRAGLPFQGGFSAGSGFLQMKMKDKVQFGVCRGLRRQS